MEHEYSCWSKSKNSRRKKFHIHVCLKFPGGWTGYLQVRINWGPAIEPEKDPPSLLGVPQQPPSSPGQKGQSHTLVFNQGHIWMESRTPAPSLLLAT